MKKYHQKRGMVLMLVMVIMALLATLLMSFLMMVSQTRIPEGNETGGSAGAGSMGHRLRDKAITQLLVGSDDGTSVIGPHSILENLYGQPVVLGNDLLTGNLTAPLTANGISILATDLFPTAPPVKPLSLMGTVITFTDMVPPKSWRITEVKLNGTNIDLIIPGAMGAYGRYLINGAPFSGTGIGFDVAAAGAKLTLKDGDGVEAFLRPNPLAPAAASSSNTGILSSRVDLSSAPAPDNPFQEYLYSLKYGFTSANPDYTAADFNTMFLAKQDIDLATGKVNSTISSFFRTFDPAISIPTWEELRKKMMRPLPYDHPDFSGSQPQLAFVAIDTSDTFKNKLANARDVDNDGDGVAESVWMDVGLPIVSLPNADGVVKQYKPLAAYLTLDLDGRVDINAHGNVLQKDDSKYGSGSGPAEIFLPNSDFFTGKVNANVNVASRYGAGNQVPNESLPIEVLNRLFPGFPATFGDLDNPDSIFGKTVPDLWGSISFEFDPLGQRGFRDPTPVAGNLFTGNPYLFNPNPHDSAWRKEFSTSSEVFSLDQFASLLLNEDVGGMKLPERLPKLLFATTGKYPKYEPTPANTTEPYLRNWLTPITADIPSPPMSIGDDLSIYDRLLRMVATNPAAPNAAELARFWAIYNALPDDLRAGRKVNLNTAVVYNNDPRFVTPEEILTAKAKFARSLFILISVLCHDEIQAYASASPAPTELATGVTNKTQYIYQRLAQWCLNIVDFTDADEIMTPLVIPSNLDLSLSTPISPFTNTDWIVDAAGIDANEKLLKPTPVIIANTKVIFGLERPNIVITETLAFEDEDDKGTITRKGALVELYNTSNPKPPNNSVSGGAIDLGAINNATDKQGVWRIAVGKKINDDKTVLANTDAKVTPYLGTSKKDDATVFQVANTTAEIDRVVWFSSQTPTTDPTPASVISYKPNNADSGTSRTIDAAGYFVVGPRKVTEIALNKTTTTPWNNNTIIDLSQLIDPNTASTDNPSAAKVKTPNWMVVTSDGGINPVGTTGFEIGKDVKNSPPIKDARIPFHKPVFLQRLADTTRAYNQHSNPYITVDWSIFDLTIYDTKKSSTSPPELASRQWGRTSHAEESVQNGWARRLKDADFKDAGKKIPSAKSGEFDPILNKWGGVKHLAAGIKDTTDTPTLFKDATCTFGFLNSNTGSVDPVADAGTIYHGRPNVPFTYLHWNDAPLASSLEALQVPASSAGRLGLEFNPKVEGSVYGAIGSLGFVTANASHRLNFFNTSNDPTKSLNLAKFFDYVALPSHFAGTIDPIHGAPRYREPGKINLNTANAKAYEALKGNRAMGALDAKPFRAIGAANRVPASPLSPVETSLLRDDDGDSTKNSGKPLFAQNASGETNTYQALASLQRLSEMTTTRSNTFAVWVTIGLFEVVGEKDTATGKMLPINGNAAQWTKFMTDHPNYNYLDNATDKNYKYFRAIHPDGYFFGAERGSDGEAVMQRFRDFYIIDRTIPVAFRRGQKHNSHDTIIYYKKLQ